MPGGPAPTAPLGLAAFAAIKFVGYSAYSVYLNNLFPDRWRNLFFVGFCRTALGLGFGTALGFLGIIAMLATGPPGFFIYIAALVPTRMLEWWIIVSAMYHVKRDNPSVKKAIGFGILVSFILDVPALMGFFATDPFWIC
jgi:hypothetical protein